MEKFSKESVRQLAKAPQTLFTKAFYQFLFSFVAVIAGVLVIVLVLGVQVN